MATSVGPDGIDVSGYGWTNQSTTFNSNKSLESYGAASSALINPALRQGYSAWTYDPIFATGTVASIATPTTAVLVYVPQSFTCSHVDLATVGTAGNITVGLWPATAPAGTAVPLAFSAATAASLGAVSPIAFNGSSSATSVNLTGGQSYFVTLFSSAATTVSCLVTDESYTANVSTLPYSITTTYRVGTVGTLTGTLTTASVFGTSTLTATIPWVGLRQSMATETVRGSIGSSVTPVTVTLSNFYQSITVENLALAGTASSIIWVRADGTAAVSEADGCFPIQPGQVLTLNNGLAFWSQVYSVLAKGTLTGSSAGQGTPYEIQPYGASLVGGQANPGVSVSVILDTGSGPVIFEVASND